MSSTLEFGNVRETLAASGRAERELFAEGGREFVAGREFDFGLHAGVVGNDDGAAGDVAKLADNGGMRAIEDAHDAAFCAASAGMAAEARDTGDDVIAVHGVVYVIARDEKIAVEIGDGDVGDDEAVAIVVKHETAGDFVAGSLLLRGPLLRNGGLVVRGSGGLVVATKNETRMREFVDEATFFQFCEHFQQGAAVGLFDL
jgi:hypothetical protein